MMRLAIQFSNTGLERLGSMGMKSVLPIFQTPYGGAVDSHLVLVQLDWILFTACNLKLKVPRKVNGKILCIV